MLDTKPSRLGSSEIAAKLRREITRGTLQPLERLMPERELADIYSVSRSMVREALNQLSNEGLVEIRRGSGTYVTQKQTLGGDLRELIANARPLEMIDARFAFEPQLCRMAVLHARSVDLDGMENLLEVMEQSKSNPTEFSLADQEFHGLLAKSTGNSLLIWFNEQIAMVRKEDEWARMRHLTLNTETITLYNKQHRQLLNAIRTREPERAASLMKEHLETARLSLTRAAST